MGKRKPGRVRAQETSTCCAGMPRRELGKADVQRKRCTEGKVPVAARRANISPPEKHGGSTGPTSRPSRLAVRETKTVRRCSKGAQRPGKQGCSMRRQHKQSDGAVSVYLSALRGVRSLAVMQLHSASRKAPPLNLIVNTGIRRNAPYVYVYTNYMDASVGVLP